MKTQVIVSLLCVTLCVTAAAVLPNEDNEVTAVFPVAVEDEIVVLPDYNRPQVYEVPSTSIKGKPNKRCPKNWQLYEGNCYLLVNLTYSWTNSEFFCESLGANMASAHSLWDYNFLQQMAWGGGYLKAWIGGYNFQDHWRWDDGTPFNYNNWHSDSSNSFNAECLHLNSQGTNGWSKAECKLEYPFICSNKLNYC